MIHGAVALGDVDGDGDPDLVFGNRFFGQQNRLFLNLLGQLDTPLLAMPGHVYRLDAYARHGAPRPGDIAFVFVSTAAATLPFPPFGTIGIDLSEAVGLPPFFIPQPAGMGSVSFLVPNDSSLIGITAYSQALLLPYGAPWRLTNVTVDQVVR